MLTQSDWEPIVRLALEETNKIIDRLVENFAPKLQTWLDDILNNPIPEDWRDELAAFVQRTADDDNLAIAPHSITTLEQIIEACIAGTDEFAQFGPAPRGPARGTSPLPRATNIVPLARGQEYSLGGADGSGQSVAARDGIDPAPAQSERVPCPPDDGDTGSPSALAVKRRAVKVARLQGISAQIQRIVPVEGWVTFAKRTMDGAGDLYTEDLKQEFISGLAGAQKLALATQQPFELAATTESEASPPLAHNAPLADTVRTAIDRGAISTEQARVRARQIARAPQNQLELTDAQRESLQQFYERVLTTGVAESLPTFLQDKLDEWERKIAAQESQPAMVAGPSSAMSKAEIDKAQADLAKSVGTAADKSFGVRGVDPGHPAKRNPLYWEEGPADGKPYRPWVLKSNLSDSEILAAFAETQDKDAGAACTNEMLCKRASSIVVINGFIDFFNKQSGPIKERGLAWVAETIRKAGGNIEKAMAVFTETFELDRGINPKNIQAGDQVHFTNPGPSRATSGDEGKNVIARGPDSFSNPYAGDPIRHSYSDIQTEIQGWTKPADKPPELDKIVVDRIRRPVLPRWYTGRTDPAPKK